MAFTRGLQGDDPRYWKAAALLKHFLANSNEDGRESSSSNFDERLWREYYAKAFEMGVRQGGARAMMAAYNAVNGVPAHVHPMLREIVVKEWGMDGILCTDGGGLALLVRAHKAYPDLPEAAAACIKAGINHFLDRHKPAVTEALSAAFSRKPTSTRRCAGSSASRSASARSTRPNASRTRRSARRTTPSPGASRRRARSCARRRASRSCCSRTRRACCRSSAAR